MANIYVYGVHCTVDKKPPLGQAQSLHWLFQGSHLLHITWMFRCLNVFGKTGAEKTRRLDPFYPPPHIYPFTFCIIFLLFRHVELLPRI